MAQPPADSSADTSPVAGEARLSGPDRSNLLALEHGATARRKFALEQIDEHGIRPATVAHAIMERFGVSRTTAYNDLQAANRELRDAIEVLAPEIGASVKDHLGRLARKAEIAGDFRSAVAAVTQLGKFCGLHEKADPALARALSDEQLQAAIASHTERRVVEMTDAEWQALVEKRAAAKEQG